MSPTLVLMIKFVVSIVILFLLIKWFTKKANESAPGNSMDGKNRK